MPLPDADHVARTCKASSLDPATRVPTPASFEFRFDDVGGWKETYLSVNWLEYLPPGDGDLPTKLTRLREFLIAAALEAKPVVKPTKQMKFAVLRVAVVHAGTVADFGTTLEARHEAQFEGDPHSGIHPKPGVESWPENKDAAAHLAVQQYLFERICHWESAVPE